MNSQSDIKKLRWFLLLSLCFHIAAGWIVFAIAPEERVPLKRGPYVVSIVEPPLPVPETPAPKPEQTPAPPKMVTPVPRIIPPPVVRQETPEPPEVLEEQGAVALPKTRSSRTESVTDGVQERPSAPAGVATKDDESPGYEPRTDTDAPGRGISERDKPQLFDRDIIAGVVRKRAEAEGISPDSSITFETAEYKYVSYMSKLRERIESIWEYPPEALSEGVYGDLYIRFVIRKDGSLGAVELVRTSGHRKLDSAALKALRNGAPYWPLPESWDTESLSIVGHFIYSIYGSYYIR